MSDEKNPLKNAHATIERAAKILGVEDWIVKKLKKSDNEFHAKFPVVLDNGREEIFEGYRIQHNNSRGPYKGGIRYDTTVDHDEVEALATWMSLKTALAKLPLGGGKGGVKFPRKPKEYSKTELERITKRFTKTVLNYNIGPDKDIPAPDVNTNPQTMAWIYDQYQKDHPDKLAWGVVTGKPLELHGSVGRNKATARGGLIVAKYLFKSSLEGQRVIIQGAGNAGAIFAELAQAEKAVVVGISDSKGGVYDPLGLPLKELLSHKEKTGSVVNFGSATGTKTLSNKEFLLLPCDILVPAATENVITEENAYLLQTKLIVELANGPTTPKADEILFERGITVLPDILANAGGVTVSYFEWVQNITGFPWLFEKEVDDRLTYTMETNAEAVFEMARKYHVHNRLAAYILAVDRLAQAMRLRGQY